jgi:hypothetical protein
MMLRKCYNRRHHWRFEQQIEATVMLKVRISLYGQSATNNR